MKRMKTGSKGLLSLVLAFVLILSLVPAAALSSPAEAAQSVTILFKNSDNWSSVFGYAWTDDGELLGNWPGKQLSKDTGTGMYALSLSDVPAGDKTLNICAVHSHFPDHRGADEGVLLAGGEKHGFHLRV